MASELSSRFISIVIPTYNRAARLQECLASLTRLDYPRELFEVIVVDDGSPSRVEDVIEPFRNQLDLTLLVQCNRGPGVARNMGAARACGALLAFIDDDCCADPHWLRSLVARAEEAPGAMVGGRITNALPDNVFSTASQQLVDFLYRYYNPHVDRARFFCSNNMAAPADLFTRLGRFDTTYTEKAAGEDRALCDKWLQRGHPLVYATNAVVYHTHHLTLATFWLQHFGYGQGAYNFRRQRAGWTSAPVRFEGLSFYIKLVISPFARSRSARAFQLAGLLAVTQVANIAGFCWEVMGRLATRQ